MAQFSKNKVIEHEKRVLIFSTILCETFLIPSSIERDMIKRTVDVLLFM